MLEKRWIAVPAQLFTANGTVDGKITVFNSTLFKVKQVIVLVSNTIPSREDLEVKRITDINTVYVGPRGGNIDSRADLSTYLIADSASIAANEQQRSKVPEQEIERLTYEEEPVVARRVFNVDQLGNAFNEDNPFPVAPVGSAADKDWDQLLLTRDPVTHDVTKATYKKLGVTVRVLDLTYDSFEDLEEVTKS